MGIERTSEAWEDTSAVQSSSFEPTSQPDWCPAIHAFLEPLYESYAVSMKHEFDSPTFSSATSLRVSKAFIPIYPNRLPNVPRSPGASRTAPLVFINLLASQTQPLGLLNRFMD